MPEQQPTSSPARLPPKLAGSTRLRKAEARASGVKIGALTSRREDLKRHQREASGIIRGMEAAGLGDRPAVANLIRVVEKHGQQVAEAEQRAATLKAKKQQARAKEKARRRARRRRR